MKDLPAVQSFLACRRIALVGVSRDPKDFSRAVFRAFRDRGYDVVPVNPAAVTIDGVLSHASLAEVRPPVEAALSMTPAARSVDAVADCLSAGVRRIWLHRGLGSAGAVSPAALAACAQAGVEVVPGECPLMYLPGTGLAHRVHRVFHRGRRPAA